MQPRVGHRRSPRLTLVGLQIVRWTARLGLATTLRRIAERSLLGGMMIHRVTERSLLDGVMVCHVARGLLLSGVMIQRDTGMFLPGDVMIRRVVGKLPLDNVLIRHAVGTVLPGGVVILRVDGPHHPEDVMTRRDARMFLPSGAMALLVSGTLLPVVGMILLVTCGMSWFKTEWTAFERIVVRGSETAEWFRFFGSGVLQSGDLHDSVPLFIFLQKLI